LIDESALENDRECRVGSHTIKNGNTYLYVDGIPNLGISGPLLQVQTFFLFHNNI